jgi:hypothetical protein
LASTVRLAALPGHAAVRKRPAGTLAPWCVLKTGPDLRVEVPSG